MRLPSETDETAEPKPTRFELVAPFTCFKVGIANGETLEIGLAGHETADPAVIAELDAQSHAVRRA